MEPRTTASSDRTANAAVDENDVEDVTSDRRVDDVITGLRTIDVTVGLPPESEATEDQALGHCVSQDQHSTGGHAKQETTSKEFGLAACDLDLCDDLDNGSDLDHDDDGVDRDDDDGVPYDRGWAWMVVFGEWTCPSSVSLFWLLVRCAVVG